jgi:hypothetical protein
MVESTIVPFMQQADLYITYVRRTSATTAYSGGGDIAISQAGPSTFPRRRLVHAFTSCFLGNALLCC